MPIPFRHLLVPIQVVQLNFLWQIVFLVLSIQQIHFANVLPLILINLGLRHLLNLMYPIDRE